MTALRSTLDITGDDFTRASAAMTEKLGELSAEFDKVLAGGGEKYVERHRKRGKMLARERIEMLIDPDTAFLELCPLAAHGSQFPVGASVVMGIGVVEGVECLIVANDPTVKGGTSNPWTLRKILRGNDIALENRLPVVSLVVVLWRGLRVTGVRVGPVGPVVMVPLVVRVLTRRCWGMAAVVVPGVTGVLGVPGVPVV